MRRARRLLRRGDAKNARCARVFAPRGALAFAFSGYFPSILAKLSGPGPPEFPTSLGREGPGGFIGLHPTLTLALPSSTSVSSESPDTFRRRCQPTSPRATADKSDQAHPSPQPRSQEFSHFNFFFCLPSKCRSSDLSINLHFFGAIRVHDNKNKTRCSQLRARNRILHTKYHQSLSGKIALRAPCRCLWRSSRPLARVRPCMITHLFSPAADPAPPSPRSPRADTIFPRPSLDIWITRPTCSR